MQRALRRCAAHLRSDSHAATSLPSHRFAENRMRNAAICPTRDSTRAACWTGGDNPGKFDDRAAARNP
jgi:hypothetical protein